MEYEYSPKELNMFRKLGYNDDFIVRLPSVDMYRIACHDAFIQNKKGKHVVSLRKTAKTFLDQRSTIKRMTPEFDKLIHKNI